ncbi:MAG: CBS domain-containing protein [Deltaproteobacteria bacterium]|nr:CBS domain-containing protein [Deltaproteobacteria bacterium]
MIWVRKAARYVEEYNFVSLPVVDREGKLAGVVMVDDVIDYIRDEQHEEVLQLVG